MMKKEPIEDIYMIDTSDIDLAQGIEEEEAIDLDRLIKQTKEKLNNKEKWTLRQRFYMANNVVKAAVVAGIIFVGGTTVTATALSIVKYIPNVGMTREEKVMVLPAPYTTTTQIKGKGDKSEYYYLRIVGLSYNGKVLEIDMETNWREKIYNKEGEEIGHNFRDAYLKGNEEERRSPDDHITLNSGDRITQLHYKFHVDSLEQYMLILPMDSENRNVFEIPLKDITLEEPKTADSVEQLGQVSKSKEISLVAIQSQNNGVQNIDFIPSKLPQDIEVEGLYEYKIVNDAGEVQKILNDKANSGATSYALLEGEGRFMGQINASKLQISKKIDQVLHVELPKAGETKKINQTILIDGIEVIINSVTVDNEADKESGGYWTEVAYKIKQSKDSEYSLGGWTHAKHSVMYKEKEYASYSHSDHMSWNNFVIPTEEFEPGAILTIKLDSIKDLILDGNWSWNMDARTDG